MQNFDFILFGATGDLAMRKIFPSLYQAYYDGLLSLEGKIIATSRTKFGRKDFLKRLETQSKIHIKNYDEKKWEEFTHNIYYLSININEVKEFNLLNQQLSKNSKNIIIYFSISPEFFIQACENLTLVGLNDKRVKIVLEKPLGMDLKSCCEINEKISKFYKETQIYRIDHYLGKESVRNILKLRAFNPIFQALWNKKYIQCIEISVFETLGVENRGEFYDHTGALRDMLQNHILQILSLIAMKIPKNFDANSIRKAKLKILKSLKPLKIDTLNKQVIRAQYVKNEEFKSYLEEKNIKAKSQTETFVALKAELMNKTWQGVPFYLRTGKRMAESFAHIVISFKNKKNTANDINKLIISLQPHHRISFEMNIKKIGSDTDFETKVLNLDLNHNSTMQSYERLILDIIESNPASFNHKEELEAAWKWVDPILKNWKNKKSELFFYPAKSWGPKQAFELIEKDGCEWYNI